MAFESLTDTKIAHLIGCSKLLTNSQTRVKLKDGHEQVNYRAISTDDSGAEFEIHISQLTRIISEDKIHRDYYFDQLENSKDYPIDYKNRR